MNIADLLQPPAWHGRAACRGMGPTIFYPVTDLQPVLIRRALAACDSCRVRTECAAAGRLEEYGIWGGLKEHERRQQRRGALHV